MFSLLRITVLAYMFTIGAFSTAQCGEVTYLNYEDSLVGLQANTDDATTADHSTLGSGESLPQTKPTLDEHLSLCNLEVNAESAREAIWYSSAELLLLSPRYSTPSFGIYDESAGIGARAVLGREEGNGYGMRGRLSYTTADVDVGTDTALIPNALLVTNTRIDLDVLYRRFTFEKVPGSIVTGGGVSVARVDFAPDDEFQSHETAVGPTIFVEGRTFTHSTPTYVHTFIWNGRWSTMGGTWRDRGRSGRIDGNGGMDILEVSVGTEWIRKFNNSYLVIKNVFEAQSWSTTYFNDITFQGIAIGASYNW